jgi:hypothetical protein
MLESIINGFFLLNTFQARFNSCKLQKVSLPDDAALFPYAQPVSRGTRVPGLFLVTHLWSAIPART